MNMKFGLVTGAAIACAVMTGCKAPKAGSSGGTPMEPTRPVRQTQVVTVDEPPPGKPAVKPVESKPVEAPHCKCAPGMVHESACTCGAPDCKCQVKAAEPEYTVYRVKNGDILSSICATYGLKQRKVIELNPGLNPNKLYAGRTIKLPGNIELKGDDATNASKPAAVKKAPQGTDKDKKAAAKVSDYKGATKEYVVQNGDSLGKIAYANGVTIKCLKEMNGLKNNNIRIGQKLKVPAEKPVAAPKPAGEKTAAKKTSADSGDKAKKAAEPEKEKSAETETPAGGNVTTPEAPASDTQPKNVEAADAVEQVKKTTEAIEQQVAPTTHTVKEGEDIVSIAIQYNVSPSVIMDLNDLKKQDQLTPGQVLKLPANIKAQ